MIPVPAIRVYADTSVYGGVFDQEFRAASETFFNQVQDGRFRLVTSVLVADELIKAPKPVKQLFDELHSIADVQDISDDALHLQMAYLNAGILTPHSEPDALHVALATVSASRLLISWNFRHIVNFRKIPLYNGVNQSMGYGMLGIHTPQEVIQHEEESL